MTLEEKVQLAASLAGTTIRIRYEPQIGFTAYVYDGAEECIAPIVNDAVNGLLCKLVERAERELLHRTSKASKLVDVACKVPR
jgi:hypothetical protein